MSFDLQPAKAIGPKSFPCEILQGKKRAAKLGGGGPFFPQMFLQLRGDGNLLTALQTRR
jgi:hypothetical protein